MNGATAGPDDASSIMNPTFASATDLHITGGSSVIDAGTTIAIITNDIDMQARPNGAAWRRQQERTGLSRLQGRSNSGSTTYAGNEGTMATITVNRTGGSSGSVTVDYTLTDGSATGGVCGSGGDYVNPGIRRSCSGDTITSQTFTVTLCSDAVFDPNETLTLTLSNATGGATIGANNPATLTITDVPPPFNGSYDVGSGQNYTSLTNTGGIFAAINQVGAQATLSSIS